MISIEHFVTQREWDRKRNKKEKKNAFAYAINGLSMVNVQWRALLLLLQLLAASAVVDRYTFFING